MNGQDESSNINKISGALSYTSPNKRQLDDTIIFVFLLRIFQSFVFLGVFIRVFTFQRRPKTRRRRTMVVEFLDK